MINVTLQPGVSVLERLSFRGKFALIGVIIFSVIITLTVLLARNLWVEVDGIKRERQGMEMIAKVVPVLINIQKHRGMNSAYLGGDASSLTKIQAINAEQEQLIAKVDGEAGIQNLGAEDQWASIKAAWQEIRDRSSGYSRPQSFAEHTKLVDSMRAFVIQLADASGVTLDSEMDTYYLQDTALVKLIALSESIGKLRAKGTGVLSAGSATPEERAELTLLSGSIDGYVQSVSQNLAKATNKRPELKTQLNAPSEKISSLILTLQQTVRNEVLAETPTLLPATFFSQATATIDSVLELYGQTDKALNAILISRESALRQSMLIYLAAIALMGFVTIYFFMAMSASISAAVREIDSVVDSFSKGDLKQRIRLASRDEMGNIASRFNQTGERLREIMISVENSVDAVFSETAALQASAQQISSDSELESDSVQATAAAIEEITVSITHVADSSREASHAATDGVKLSDEGERTVLQAATQMNSIAATVGQSAALIEGLNERARQISSIVEVIRDIAEQTNLLALNAAIEAARAGEQGRGFAVVADEVRKLSERTGNATNEITAMIGNIQSETANAVTSMKTGSTQASSGVKLAEEAAASLAQIQAGSNDTRQRIQEISEAMNEQSAATTEIAQSLERISVKSEHTNLEIQNAVAAISRLERMAEQLRKDVAYFQV